MRLILKNLKQKQFNIEVESEKCTVKDLKLAIEKAHGFDASLIKLLHNGRVLENEKTLEEYTIKEDNVVVMMNTKAKPNNPPPEQPKVEEPPKETKPSEPQNSQPSSQPQPQLNNESIDSLVEMGYERSKVEAALRASQGSVDLAIEFLSNGNIPEPSGQSNNPEPQPQPRSEPVSGGNGNINDLKKHAAIIKILCHKEPSKIFNILNRIKETNPTLTNLIKENEAEFKNLLIAPISQEDLQIFNEYHERLGRTMGNGPRPGQITITLTKEEGEAVKRLKELGNFSQEEVLQAFIACDKNEEATANYLFEQKWREDNDNNK